MTENRTWCGTNFR